MTGTTTGRLPRLVTTVRVALRLTWAIADLFQAGCVARTRPMLTLQ